MVIPSMPGYGFSGKPTHNRLGSRPYRACLGRADEAPWLHEICGARRRLGCDRHRPHGRAGSTGIARHSHQHARHFPAEIDEALSGAPRQRGSQPMRSSPSTVCSSSIRKGIAYGFQMGPRPQTLYGIADSPVGLAACFLDHDARSYELIARVFRWAVRGPYARRYPRQHHHHLVDEHGAFRRPSLLGILGKGYFNAKGVTYPGRRQRLPDELYPTPRSWAEQAYPKLIHYNKLDKGGHFAAWEQPGSLPKNSGPRSDRCAEVR